MMKNIGDSQYLNLLFLQKYILMLIISKCANLHDVILMYWYYILVLMQ